MRVTVLSLALCFVVAGIQAAALPAVDGVAKHAMNANGNTVGKVVKSVIGGAHNTGLFSNRKKNDHLGIPDMRGCPASGCPSGPTQATDAIGIIKSVLKELYPTLSLTTAEANKILAAVRKTLDHTHLTKGLLQGQKLGLLSDLLEEVDCTVEQFVLAIEKVVCNIAQKQ